MPTEYGPEWWEGLAAKEDRAVAEGYAICPEASKYRAETYRRVVESFRLEERTGEPHCSCCLRPVSEGMSFQRRR
jgi:hypothetical protein